MRARYDIDGNSGRQLYIIDGDLRYHQRSPYIGIGFFNVGNINDFTNAQNSNDFTNDLANDNRLVGARWAM